ncbi:MAG: DNA polymerase IV [Marinoscillum sp.]|uniref:DNA polymerase IV n=2 Tax=Marinoscillum sp. TaxID=2024838 RepID=UPI003303F340
MENHPIRKIIHIDMDAFFASVEQHDHPELKGKPIAVGGNKERGVVAAASYEARKYGVKSAMPSAIAARQCPHLIFVKPRFERYQEISLQIRNVFQEYTDLIEPLSLDEAYLDVTENKPGLTSATIIAREIKAKIKERTGLTASAGISYCKFLAKTASDVNKPNGLFVILPEDAEEYLKKMPIHRFFGIGKATAEKMKTAGIFTGGDLRKKTLSDLTLRYGKAGAYYYDICRGIDLRPVKPDRERKSVSAEHTFDHNLMRIPEVKAELDHIAAVTFERYSKHGTHGRTVTIKVKYGDFKQITRSISFEENVTHLDQLIQAVHQLTDQTLIREEGIRLLGVGISNFQKKDAEDSTPIQLTLDF